MKRLQTTMTTLVSNKLRPFHVEMLLDSSEGRLPEGCRLSKKSWKTPAKEKNNPNFKLRPAVCVAVPMLKVSCDPAILNAAMQGAFENLQDAVISEAIDAAILADTAINLATIEIEANSITFEGIATWSATQAVSGRLSGAQIEAWFDANLAEELSIKLAEIPDIDAATLEKAVKQHKDMFAKLASPKAVMPEKLTKQLQKALGLVVKGDKVKNVLEAKLASFLKPVELEDLIDLPE